MNTPNPSPSPASGTRKRGLVILSCAVALAGVAYGTYWYEYGRWHEETDDAYVSGHVVQVTPHVGGTVLAVKAEDTDMVKAGATLIELDPADARVALDQAEASLAQTVREVRTLFANNATLAAQVRVRETEVERWKQDLARRQAIAETGAVALEEIDHARDSLRSAEASLVTAREQLAANRAQTEGTQVTDFPAVQRAGARVEEAWLAVARTHVVAPLDGQIARRNVQVGQRVAPGAPLMAVVPLDSVWVDANFKETQLREMRVGQPVVLTADIYGSKVEYQGRIAGLGAGTGGAFALLPAQNATGNWIKVVQRVPVRISLDPQEIATHPLRVGLSMIVNVDTHSRNGQPVLQSRAEAPRFEAAEAALAQAKARVDEIIRRNLGQQIAARG
ncbi:MAG: EmrA/EmrK family multidrug efflux transporter periplasmic adaptor subunit [Candidatus Dactylopiibacterium carminicum]|uniref:EmrA/EmrK family multidrug efflux transporter periplasmic adaptor subunit n=1 Tax=Candidatus Dactylopiibacterium carminicum TaxID=857335 RepID=A0A272EXC2_9RHOO|nr:HlyD family efflux transporter periplasmic adaptor subunit [Candidatus Dactylopiibacterium carminicum]KAF7599516.1 EmrA/EmrK family multidrug efflux transporter periplasmic adaptor subunit [Candidatus Dactylopiibacterium carminicum]PAS94290.1 MAG: EmrA/EmrK family multidrug efflux transporter periplasmic adaptor subunit [Candidatus Dactylopiibacterium carminicum]PAS98486.1 MAG: EmrA/EmrK family multidrug efflux transporter periplasmic adaptor subunit [Candidatus Dactylopiibacterium carminicum